MAGFINDVLLATRGTFSQAAAGVWWSFNDGSATFGYYNHAGSPEGAVTANKGSWCSDTTNGAFYVKTTNSSNTGWAIMASGDVVGPGSSTDNALARFDGTTGKLIQNSVITEDDTGNLSISADVSGSTLSITLSNSSNTASASAKMNITVAGTTAADPQTTYTVTGATTWSTGIDNSDSDKYVIAASGALGTTNVAEFNTTGGVDFVLGNVRAVKSASGTVVDLEANNSSNTAGSDAMLLATVAGSSGGDAYSRYIVTGGGVWTVGVDNSDSDAFVVSASTTPGTSNLIRGISTGGQYQGNNTNTAPPAGFIGEQMTANANIASLTNATDTNVTSISLTAGIWDVSGMSDFFSNAVTGTSLRLGISNTSNTLPGTAGVNQLSTPSMPNNNSNQGLTVCPQRVVISSTTTYYLVARANFTVGAVGVQGIITATRVG